MKRDGILLHRSRLYIPYDAYSQYHDIVHVVEGNKCDGGNNRNCDGYFNHNHDEDFDHATIRRVVINELHQAPYSVHPGYNKMVTVMWKLYL